MKNKGIYRTASQEKTRKKLLSTIFALARENNIEKDELYDIIEASWKKKRIRLYKSNFEKGKLKLSTLKQYQLRDIISEIFREKKKAKIIDMAHLKKDEEDNEKKKKEAEIIEIKLLKRKNMGDKNGNGR